MDHNPFGWNCIYMDICDVFDASGARTGRTVLRGTKLRQGDYYLVVQVWIRNKSAEYLIQKRAPHLTSGAGLWATTAGYTLAGEESISGAIREVNEELGIQLSPLQCRKFDRILTDNLMQDIWLAEVSRDAIGEPVLGSEVSDWKWAPKKELDQMIRHGEFFAYSYFDRLPE
ncbi:MAG: NUDIX domain-containing protein [Anaerolineae bacterium]|nr:NUDIX domain-containing protein [Anaerolineae bacterium]